MTFNDEAVEAPSVVDEPQQEQQAPNQDPPSLKLYNRLNKDKLYTKSYEEFQKQFSTPEAIGKLHKKLNEDGLYTKTSDDFLNQFFPQQIPKAPKKTYLSLTPAAPKQTDYLQVVGIPTMEETAEKNHVEAVDKAHKTIDNILGSGEKLQPIAADLLKTKVKDNLKSSLYNNPMASDNARISHQQVETQIDNGGYLHITPEEVYDFTKQIQQDPALQREALVHAKKINPKIAPEIDAALYVSDANERAVTPEKKIQIAENQKLIRDKKIKYNPGNGALIKPEGFGESVSTSYKKREEDMALFDLADNGTKAELIDKLNKTVSQQDPDAPVPVPTGFTGAIGDFAGGQGKITAEAAAAQALNLIAPGAGEAVAAGLYAHEMGRRGYANELVRSYGEYKRQGASDEDALEKAQEQAKRAMMVDATVGAVMGKSTTKSASKLLSAPAKDVAKLGQEGGWFQGVIKNGYKKIGEETPTAFRNAGLAGGGEVAKNISANQLGQDRDILEGSGSAAANMLALHYTLAAGLPLLGKGLKDVSKTAWKKVVHGLSKAPIEDLKTIAREQVADGIMTPQEAAQNISDIEAHKEIDQQIPQSVKNDEVRLELHKKVERRVELEEEAKTVNPAFKEPIKAKIEKLDGEINEIVNSPEAKEESPKPEPEKLKPNTFKTSKGSVYTVNEDGTTTRDKSYHPEHGGDAGIKDKSQKTYYVTKEDLDKLSLVQTQGWKEGTHPIIGEMPDGKIGVGIVGGENHGLIAKGTDVTPKTSPEKGLYPVEVWNNGKEHHFGNVITEVGEPAKPRVTVSTPKIVNVKLKGEVPKEPVVEPETQVTPAIEISDSPMAGITHAATEELRSKYKLGDYERKNATDAELEAAADDAISKGYDIENLVKQLESGTPPTGVENFILKKYVAALDAKFEKSRSDKDLAQIERVVSATDKIGSLQSESFRTRKGLVPSDDTLAGMFIREKQENNAGLPLSEKQKETVTKEFEDLKSAKDKYQAYVEKKEAELAEREAKLKVEQVAKSTKKRSEWKHEDFVKERKDIVAQMRADLLKVAKGQGGLTASVPGVAQLVAIAPHVAKMVRSLAEEGIIEFEKVLKNVHGQLKEVLPDIEEGQVRDMIAGKYNEKKGTRNETAAKVQDIKTEARLLGELEDLMNGKEPAKESAAKRRSIKIEELRKKIKSLRDEQGLTDPAKLQAIKTRLKKQLEAQEEKLKSGNFDPEPKKKPVQLDEEGQKLQDELIKKKIEIEVARLKRKYEVETNFEKGKRIAIEIANVPRTVMSSMDLSAPFRQGLVSLVAHPVTGVKAMAKMLQAAKSQKVFDRWFFDLQNSREYEVMKESGLAITDPHDPKLAAKEEAFMNNLAQKIPFIGRAVKYGNEGKSIGGLISGSERAYVLFLNKMRADVFNKGLEAFEAEGKTFRNSPELYKALADHVNNITGRGSLGKAEIVSPYLNTAFFSPRLMMSRIKLLTNFINYPGFYKKVPKEVRKMYFRDMAKFVAFGATMLGLAKVAGADVETDPRSTDAFKIKTGDTRYDILGGFQQYIRFISQFVSGQKKSAKSGEIKELDGEGSFGEDRGDITGRFLRGKLAPVPALILDAASGRDLMGNKIVYDQGFNINSPYKKEKTWVQEYGGSFLPLIASDIKGAFEKEGIKSLLTVGVPAALGVGTQTFSDDDRPKRPKASTSTKKPSKPSRPTRDRRRK